MEDQPAIHSRFAVPFPLPNALLLTVQALAVRPDLDFRVLAAGNNLRFVCNQVPVLRDGFNFCVLPGFGYSLQAGLCLFRQKNQSQPVPQPRERDRRADRYVLRMSTSEQLRFEFDLPVLSLLRLAADCCTLSLVVCGLADRDR